jgi:hypothetical protein
VSYAARSSTLMDKIKISHDVVGMARGKKVYNKIKNFFNNLAKRKNRESKHSKSNRNLDPLAEATLSMTNPN